MAIVAQGAQSTHVLNGAKLVCPYCGGVEVMLTSLMDELDDILTSANKDWDLTNDDGKKIQGLVGLCAHCGTEWVPLWYAFDVATFDGATACVMTNLDVAATANTLATYYVCVLVGTDIGKYVAIASNTAAQPTTITLSFAVANDGDGIVMITNIEPIGMTKIVA